MSSTPPFPDEATIEAWLAGDLPPGEAADLERQLSSGSEDTQPINPDLLRSLSEAAKNRTAAKQLTLPRTHSEGAWREILTHSDNPDILGTLGHYEVLELIAAGGMGILVKARDPQLDRLAALKILAPEFAINATARTRFLREARAAARLEHENVLPIYGVYEEAVPWFAMRYVSGGSLEDVLSEGFKFDITKLKSIARQSASALEAAHKAGIVHRDIKPGNILLDDEKVWVCDFGIARSMNDPSLTYAGAIAGTPQYMSPEQAAGTILDGRSDLFSLGAVLYRCATGEQAFPGESTESVLQNIASKPPKPLKSVPKWFAHLLTNLLAKNPADRPLDAAAVIRAIDDEQAPRPKASQRRRMHILIASGVAALGFLLLQTPFVRKQASKTIAAISRKPILVDSRLGSYATLQAAADAANDGDVITFPDGDTEVDLVEIPQGKHLTLRGSDNSRLVRKSPGVPGITARSPLILEHLTFHIVPTHNGEGILRVSSDGNRISNCKFTTDHNQKVPFPSTVPRIIEILNGGTILIESCTFNAGSTIPIGIVNKLPGTHTTSIRINDCTASASVMIHSRDWTRAKRQPIDLSVDNLKFTGNWFYKHSPTSPIPDLQSTINNSTLTLSNSVYWFDSRDEKTVQARLRSKGSGNRFPAGNACVLIGEQRLSRSTFKTLPLTSFDASGVYSGQDALKGTITVNETGEVFADLLKATEAAPDGATLTLSGRFEFENEVITPRAKTVHFQSNSNSPATIASTSPRKHAIFINGPGSVRGIRFECLGAGKRSMPILGFNGRDDEVLVEDCQFIVEPENADSDHHRGLCITDSRSATVRRCLFRVPQGSCFLNGSNVREIKFEQCIFIGATAIEHRLIKSAEIITNLQVDRCVFINDRILDWDNQYKFEPIKLKFKDNLLDVDGWIFDLPDIDAGTLQNLISWEGNGDIITEKTKALRTYRDRETSSFVPVTLETFDDMAAQLQINARNNGTIASMIFDRNKLPHPITAAALLDALNKDIKSPAVETLRLINDK
jgi:serine/threonine protein kinase